MKTEMFATEKMFIFKLKYVFTLINLWKIYKTLCIWVKFIYI